MKINRLSSIGRGVVTCGLSAALALGGLAGCAASTSGSASSGTTQAATASASGERVNVVDASALFTDRDLTPSYDASKVTATIALADGATKVEGTGVTVTDDIVTITAEGIYEVSGTLSGGQLRVDAKDAKVQIVLKDASITGGSSAALYVKEADKVFVTLPEGSSSKLVTSGEFIAIDENDIDGVIFAKDDLTINGAGSLSVTTNYGHGIVGKDEVTLVSGTVSVDVSGDAIKANDSLAVHGGSYQLACDGKALEVSNSDDATLGFVYVEDGSFTISAVDDALNASGAVQIDGGTWDVSSGDDGIHSDSDLVFNGGSVTVKQSVEGLEGATITVTGGEIDVTSSDDGVNAVGTSGGSTSSTNDMGGFGGGGMGGQMPTSGQAPATPDASQVPVSGQAPAAPDGGQMMTPPDGQMMTPPTGEMPTPPDGGQMMTPPDGGQMPGRGAPGGQGAPTSGTTGQNTDATSPTTDSTSGTADQGFGGRGGMGGGRGFGGMGGGMMMDTDETAKFTITGGKLTVNAGGDGLDSNGTVSIEGGETYVSGATNSGNAALDFGLGGTISGGVFVATGMSGMVEMLSEESSQASAMVYLDANASGTVKLADSTGKELLSFDAPKEYNCVIVSAPGLSESGTYKLTSGSTETEIAMSGKVTSVGNAANRMGGGMGGFGGGMGGHGGMGGGRRGMGDQTNAMQMQPTTSA